MKSLKSRLAGWAVNFVAGVALSAAAAGYVAAQEIEPNEFVPAPDGTNLAIGYYLYGHNDSYKVPHGPQIANSGLEVNIAIARFVHFFDVAGHPAGVQVLEAFGGETSPYVGGQRIAADAYGASNLNLSAFYWPYANNEAKEYLIVAGFLYPPVGTYDKNAALNLASAFGTPNNGWAGDVQLGWDQGIGEHFSYDASFDARAFGPANSPGGIRNTKDVEYRLQAWANWNWTAAFKTSIGWETFLGGDAYINGHHVPGLNSESERIRAAAALFVAANAQVLLELNHEFVATSGFKQVIGATARFVYIF